EALRARAIEPDALDQEVGALAAQRLGHAVQAAGEIEQLGDRQVVVKVRLLWQKAELFARGAARNRVTEDRRGAAARAHQADEHADRRRLTGAVGSDEAEDAAAPDVERDAEERLDLLATKRRAVRLPQIADLDDGVLHVRTNLPPA